MKVFLSWSGKRSNAVAKALHEWLPLVINVVDPWMSEADIAAGAPWSLEIAGSLKDAGFGVVCVTPENRDRPWLLFEAGALSNPFEKARVAPYLHGFKDKSMPGSPLSQLQAKLADKEGTADLVKSVNGSLGERKLDAKRLEKAFDKWWPDLEAALGKIPPDDNAAASPKPSTDDRLAELLDLARSQKAEIDAVHELLRQTMRSAPGDALLQRLLQDVRASDASKLANTVSNANRAFTIASDWRVQQPRTKDELIEAMDQDARGGDDPDDYEDDNE